MTDGLVLDAGALIAVERDDRVVAALLGRLNEVEASVVVPTTALAQVVRDRSTQAGLNRLLKSPRTIAVELDEQRAIRIGDLLRRSGTSDVVDAHVVLCALERRMPIATSDAGDLQRLDGSVRLIDV